MCCVNLPRLKSNNFISCKMQQTKKSTGLLSHYQILDVPRDATFDEIKKSFYKKIKEIHPDKAVQSNFIFLINKLGSRGRSRSRESL